MNIRKAIIEDAGTIDKLNEEFFHEEWRDWGAFISSEDSEMFALELNGAIIGLGLPELNTTIGITRHILSYPRRYLHKELYVK